MMGFGLIGLLLMVLFWGGLIGLALLLIWRLFPRTDAATGPGRTSQSAQEILDVRFARGEVSRDEYELIRRDLS